MGAESSPKISKFRLFVVTLILCCQAVTPGKCRNLSTFMELTGWTPPVLEMEVSQLNMILQTSGLIQHAEPIYFTATLSELIRKYFVRINCITDEDSAVDFNLLRTALSTIQTLNQNNSGFMPNISLYLSLVPGVENAPSYYENLALINATADDFKGVISYVLLDLSSVDVGPLDGYSLTQKWAACNELARVQGFVCGFIFDFRACIEKISIFGHIHSEPFTPVFLSLRHDTYKNITGTYHNSAINLCVNAIDRSDMELASFLDDENKILLNSTHFYVENMTLKRSRAGRISSAQFQLDASKPGCHLKTRKVYSKISRNQSTSAMVSISPQDLYGVLSDDVYIRDNGTYHGNSFMELLHRFLVIFPSNGVTEGVISMPVLFEAIIGYAETYNNIYLLRPLQLWIAFSPIADLRDELKTVLKHVNEINSKLPGTVVYVLIDYNRLRIDSSVVSVVKNDIEICNGRMRTSIRFGYIFHVRNCRQNLKWLRELPFQDSSVVLMRAEWLSYEACKGAVNHAHLGVLRLKIKIDWETKSVSIPPLFLEAAQGDYQLSILMVISRSEGNANVNGVALYSERWLHTPLTLSKPSIAYAVQVEDLSNTRLLPLVTDHDYVVIRINGDATQEQTATELKSFCASHQKTRSINKASILIPYKPDLADNIRMLIDILSDILLTNSHCAKVFSEVLIEWERCLVPDACPPLDIEMYGKNHFADLANITTTMERIMETTLKTGLIISFRTVKFLMDACFLALNAPDEHLEDDLKGRVHRVSSFFNVSETLKMLDQFHTFIYEPDELSIGRILDAGAVQYANDIIKILEAEAKFIQVAQTTLFAKTDREKFGRFRLRVIDCYMLNSTAWNETLEYVRFWEIINNWADKMEFVVIMDSAYKSLNPNESKRCKKYPIECACGWWTLDQTSGKLLDQKSYAVAVMNRLTKKTSQNAQSLLNISPLWIVALLFPILLIAISVPLTVHFCSKRYILSKREVTELLSELPSNVNPAIDMSEYELVGQGSSKSRVYKCTLKTGNEVRDVAVKAFKADSGDRLRTENLALLRGLVSEAKTLRSLKFHPNIVKYFGICTAKLRQGELRLVLEYCPSGSLHKVLTTAFSSIDGQDICNNDSINGTGSADINSILLKWCAEIASGLEFLASENIVHVDIATRNILLDKQMSCKICDFGLSRNIEKYKIYVKTGEEPLPWRWMAPESLRKLIFNEKTDVWMFGVTLWEIYTFAQVPYGGLSWSHDFVRLLECGLRLEIPSRMPTKVVELIKACWDMEVANRPEFSICKSELMNASQSNQ